jgi:3-hydroxybutyryl-CoA dehydrogenase
MGPFTLMDYIGLDVIYHVAEIMFEEYKEPKFAAPPLLKQMVNSGYLGKKSGAGFYHYSGEEPLVNKLNL